MVMIYYKQSPIQIMHKGSKKDQLRSHLAHKHSHSRQPSSQRQRDSHPRLTVCASPPLPLRKTNHYLSSPNSLQKHQHKQKGKQNKPKAKRKLVKGKKLQHEATRQTIQTVVQQPWKQHLKLTFRSRKHTQKDITLRNNSLKCMEELAPIDSYSSLINTFPRSSGTPAIPSKERVYLIDWLNFVATEMLLRKNTLHLAVAFLDAYLQRTDNVHQKLQVLGAGALLLAVKQEERGCQGEILSVLSNCQGGFNRDQIIKVESSIVLGLGFKLNFSTLPFWFDYFSQKWDSFCVNDEGKHDFKLALQNLAVLRSPQGHCYKHYRQATQLLDALLMNPTTGKADFPKLALAVLYLVARVQTESKITKQDSATTYSTFCQGFTRKASPIFRDYHCFNQVFNEFVVETCDFEMTSILSQIRTVGSLLSMGFTYEIDSRVYQSSQNYEQFLRFCSYSEHIRNYFLCSA